MSQPPTSHSSDAGRYAANARFVAELAAPVVELLAPRTGWTTCEAAYPG